LKTDHQPEQSEMNILILGKNGQVGRELLEALGDLADITAYGRQEADLADTVGLQNKIKSSRPDAIINAAAFTAVDAAESAPKQAFSINAKAPKEIAKVAAELSVPLIHFSTDYVFDGRKKTDYVEDDCPNPINVYGRSKLDGEEFLRASQCQSYIFRTSWVVSATGNNFIKTMIKLMFERDTVQVVNDQFGCPTSAALLAEVCTQTLENNFTLEPGIYHVTHSGKVSWYDVAVYVKNQLQSLGFADLVSNCQVLPIASAEYHSRAARPQNSKLCTNKLTTSMETRFSSWQQGVRPIIEKLAEKIIDE
jgi:dTDP-4-dehydrorhamnose reductase